RFGGAGGAGGVGIIADSSIIGAAGSSGGTIAIAIPASRLGAGAPVSGLDGNVMPEPLHRARPAARSTQIHRAARERQSRFGLARLAARQFSDTLLDTRRTAKGRVLCNRSAGQG